MSVRKIIRKIVSALTLIVQLCMICLSFLLFTSTIKIFPWYESEVFAAYMVLMFLMPIQGFIAFIVWEMYQKSLTPRIANIVSNINTVILYSIIFILMINENLIYPFAAVYAILECLLALALIFPSIKWLITKGT